MLRNGKIDRESADLDGSEVGKFEMPSEELQLAGIIHVVQQLDEKIPFSLTVTAAMGDRCESVSGNVAAGGDCIVCGDKHRLLLLFF
jgi:hypothetical protein